MTELMDILANGSFWVAVLRTATPLLLGTLGVLLCERAGVLNLGIEGIMVAGAFAGWLTVYAGHGLWTGVLVAALTGAAASCPTNMASEYCPMDGIPSFGPSSTISSVMNDFGKGATARSDMIAARCPAVWALI